MTSRDGAQTYSMTRSLNEALGLESLLVHFETLEPGKSGSRPHSHSTKDEIFIITRGSGTAWVNGEPVLLTKGDAIAFKGADGEAHVLTNTGSEPMEYTIIASNPDDDVVTFA